MKTKIILITLLALIFTISSNAQIKWGIYGGGSVLTYEDQSSPVNLDGLGSVSFNTNFKSTGSYNLGIFLEFRVWKSLRLESGITMGNKGFKRNENIDIDESGPLDKNGVPEWHYSSKQSYNFSYKMPYVGVPMVFNYYLLNRKFKLYASLGHKLGLCFNGTTDNYRTGGSSIGNGSIPDNVRKIKQELPNSDIKVGRDDAFKAFHYDLVYGGGIGIGRFCIVYSYDYGLLNNSQSDQIKFKSRVHNVCLKIDFSKHS
ncbi:outer membrane beta-barrel protein [Plebeiibacterium sediminum]|uniref:PorT family protein n=1 Tax=Plebeiibacterium sediminum TaxID=2992112 RepID=A0AAE3SHG6_9BACT|nr:outer membrane beta-barrel protein [Plebeiobacterium sediminum]MCW3789242.1 PorT family protein [Plebeiobacterium sediminum]